MIQTNHIFSNKIYEIDRQGRGGERTATTFRGKNCIGFVSLRPRLFNPELFIFMKMISGRSGFRPIFYSVCPLAVFMLSEASGNLKIRKICSYNDFI